MSQALTPEQIAAQLDALAALLAQQQALEAAHRAACEAVFSPLVKRRLQQLRQQQLSAMEPLQAQIDAVDATVRSATLAAAVSVKGRALQAVYSAGRVSWDSRALEGYMAAGHGELAAFRHIGTPSVTLRRIVGRTHDDES